MVSYIKDSGHQTIKNKDLEDRYGLMALSIKVCGIKIWLMGKED
jgi:hypothetical protein